MTTDNPLEDGIPRLAESSAAVPEDVHVCPGSDRTPAATEDGVSVVQEVTPSVQLDTSIVGDDTPPVPAHAAPPVAAGDLFISAEKITRRTSARSPSRPPSVARVIRTAIAYILLLAVLGAAGIAAFSLVQGT